MTVNINIGSGDGKSASNVYDDGGNKVQESGPPPEFATDEDPDEAMDSDADPDADPSAEAPEGDPEASGMDDPGMDPEADADPSAGAPEGDDSTEDISGEVDGGDERIAQLANDYDISELIKALALAAESSDMTEGMNYGELPEALQKKIDEKKNEHKEEPEKEVTEHGEEDKDEEVSEHGEEDKKDEDEDDEKVDHGCGDTYAEETSTEATGALDHSEAAVGDHGISTLQARVADLEAELARQKRIVREKEISDFVETVFDSGKLVEGVVPKVDLVRFMETLNSKNTVNFSEQGKASQFDFFKTVLEKLPSMVSFEELATQHSAPPTKKRTSMPSVDGFVFDERQAELHEKAMNYAEEKGVDFTTAIKAVFTEAESN
jgi:hypothetical protein